MIKFFSVCDNFAFEIIQSVMPQLQLIHTFYQDKVCSSCIFDLYNKYKIIQLYSAKTQKAYKFIKMTINEEQSNKNFPANLLPSSEIWCWSPKQAQLAHSVIFENSYWKINDQWLIMVIEQRAKTRRFKKMFKYLKKIVLW